MSKLIYPLILLISILLYSGSANARYDWKFLYDTKKEPISAIAIAPFNPDIIYIGLRPGIGILQINSLLKSKNGGKSFTPLLNGIRTGTKISTIVINPKESNILYVGTIGEGIYKSTNAGNSLIPCNNGMTNPVVRAIAIDYKVPTTIYAGTSSGLFKSTNRGDSWALCSRSLTDNTGLIDSTVYTIAIDPVNQNIYISGRMWSIFKSTNGGNNWKKYDLDVRTSEINFIKVNPNIHNIIYAGTQSGGIYRSTDGGEKWNEINNGLDIRSNYNVNSIVINRKNPKTIYISAGDIFKSKDGGENWTNISKDIELSKKFSSSFVLATEWGQSKKVYVGTEA